MKKLISLLLASLLLLSALSCSQNNSGDESESAESTSALSETAAETETEDDTKTHYADEIEAVDYEGWVLNIANDSPSEEYFGQITVEDLTGDAFNDAIYERNSKVSEKFNITMVENTNGSVSLIKNSVTAGSNDVGFGYVLFGNCMELISNDFVKPITDMPVFDLDKPYWDKGSRETLTFGGKLYYGHCDLGFDHYESMAVLFYNGQLLTDNNITETPYELYTSGKWTLDAMYDMMQVVSVDVNGDGVMDENDDIFGWAGREFQYLPSLFSSNVTLLKYDESENTFKMNVADETVMAVGDMMNKIINDTNISLPGRNDTTRNLFKEGKVLFYSRLMGDYRNLRDKEDDYGIISYPSLEENTDGMVYVQNPFTILIPSNCDNDERLATLIEALSAETYDSVLDIYVEKAVIGKGTRDIESAAMMRDMISRRAYDLCLAFDISSPKDVYQMGLKNGSYASQQKKYEKIFSKGIDRIMKALGADE